MNLQKYTRAAVVGLITHDERKCENHTNEKIDPSRSELNYNLVSGLGFENYTKRLSEVKCLNRKNVNTLASLTITAPEELKGEDQRNFFEESLAYYKEKFGAKNIISAWVHMDETTPHMHIKFIPVIEKEKEKNGVKQIVESVSFKEKCPKNFYQSNHKDFQKYIDEKLGYHIGILNGKTKGVPTVEALKELSNIEKEINTKKTQLEEVRQIKLTKPKPITKAISTFTGNYKYTDYEKLYKTAVSASEYIASLQNKYNVASNDLITVKNELEALKKQDLFVENQQLKKQLEGKAEDIKIMHETINDRDDEITKLNKNVNELSKELTSTKKTLNWYKDQYQQFLKGFRQLSEQSKERVKSWFDDYIVKYFHEDIKEQEKAEKSKTYDMEL